MRMPDPRDHATRVTDRVDTRSAARKIAGSYLGLERRTTGLPVPRNAIVEHLARLFLVLDRRRPRRERTWRASPSRCMRIAFAAVGCEFLAAVPAQMTVGVHGRRRRRGRHHETHGARSTLCHPPTVPRGPIARRPAIRSRSPASTSPPSSITRYSSSWAIGASSSIGGSSPG